MEKKSNFSKGFFLSLTVMKKHKAKAVALFLVIISAAVMESLSFGMIMPFLEIIVKGPAVFSGSLKFIEPAVRNISAQNMLFVFGIALLFIVLLKNILFIIKAWFSNTFVIRFRESWMKSIMEKYMYAEYPYLLSKKQGILLHNLITEPARAARSLQQFIEFLSKTTISTFLFLTLFIINWQITSLIAVIGFVFIIILRNKTMRYATGVGRERVIISQELNAIGAENINAIRQVKIFSLEHNVLNRFAGKLHSLMSMLIKFRIIYNLPKPIIETIVVVFLISAIFILHYVIKVPLVNALPTLAVFIIVGQRLFPLLANLYSEWMSLFTFIPSLELVHGICQEKVKQEELDRGRKIEHIKSDIIFDRASFAYKKEKPIFNDLSLVIPRGKITAIIGPSGGGKSTIVDLMAGFLKKDKGRILINGFDIDGLNMRVWRRLMGFISQDIFLFNASIEENIRLGKPNATKEKVREAAKLAHAHEFIEALTDKYNTFVGDRGLTVSGGERQRIAIARVLIRHPEILIFDEATSALDAKSEKLVQESICELRGEKTIVVIAHRLTTIKNVDKIVVIEDGKVVEEGSPTELLNKESIYKRLVESRE